MLIGLRYAAVAVVFRRTLARCNIGLLCTHTNPKPLDAREVCGDKLNVGDLADQPLVSVPEIRMSYKLKKPACTLTRPTEHKVCEGLRTLPAS